MYRSEPRVDSWYIYYQTYRPGRALNSETSYCRTSERQATSCYSQEKQPFPYQPPLTPSSLALYLESRIWQRKWDAWTPLPWRLSWTEEISKATWLLQTTCSWGSFLNTKLHRSKDSRFYKVSRCIIPLVWDYIGRQLWRSLCMSSYYGNKNAFLFMSALTEPIAHVWAGTEVRATPLFKIACNDAHLLTNQTQEFKGTVRRIQFHIQGVFHTPNEQTARQIQLAVMKKKISFASTRSADLRSLRWYKDIKG